MGCYAAYIGIIAPVAVPGGRETLTVIRNDRVIRDDEFRLGTRRICYLPNTFGPYRAEDILNVLQKDQRLVF